jgi:hypothetical protein
MRVIDLTRGLQTVVSDRDFNWLSQWSWYALNNGCGKFYAARDVRVNGVRKTILMHREILCVAGHLDGEHRNGDSLDNQRSNLRPATRTQNHANRKRLPEGKSSQFRGVSFSKSCGRWTAQISIGNRKKHLGLFRDESLAAKAYDAAAIKQFGSFANPNFT